MVGRLTPNSAAMCATVCATVCARLPSLPVSSYISRASLTCRALSSNGAILSGLRQTRLGALNGPGADGALAS